MQINQIEQIPVLLLTGYLGSGKTTLLNRILTNQRGIRFAVIVNDIGEVNIDAELIQKGGVVSTKDDSLVALQNGCICCTLKMDLVEQLHDIVAMKQFDYIVIEASGICEPEPIARTICSYPTMVPDRATVGIPKLDAIVTVVDALRMRDEFASGDELKKDNIGEEDLASLVIQQIEFCNLILLNKADEVSEDELRHVEAVIRSIQPKAAIIPCNYCDVDLAQLVHTHTFDYEEVATSATWIHEVEAAHEEHEHEHHHDDEDEGEALEYDISTFVYYRRAPFNLGRFDDFVARLWPKSVIRAKGMCYFADEYDMCYLFEQSGKQFNLRQAGQWYATMPKDELEAMMQQDEVMQRDWDDQYGDRMIKLVFIGQHMDREAIIKELDNCLE